MTSGWSAGPNLPNIYVGALGLLGFVFYFIFAKAHKYQKIGAGVVTFIFFISFVHEFTSKIWHRSKIQLVSSTVLDPVLFHGSFGLPGLQARSEIVLEKAS